jgi:hypothetical protein
MSMFAVSFKGLLLPTREEASFRFPTASYSFAML